MNPMQWLTALVVIMLEVLRDINVTDCKLARPLVLLNCRCFRRSPRPSHFLGICPKQFYKCELQNASDMIAIPACSIRRREGKTTLQAADS